MYTNRYSQFGEEVLIKEQLDRIGTCSRWCFEVGAHNGILHSNTRRFIDEGWHAVLIESDEKLFGELQSRGTANTKNVHCEIGMGDLDRILTECNAPRVIDFGVIDIDGQDFWIWIGLRIHRPRLMLVEFSPYVQPWHVPHLGDHSRPGGYNQADENRIKELGEALGYEVVGRTKVNLLFCEKELM